MQPSSASVNVGTSRVEPGRPGRRSKPTARSFSVGAEPRPRPSVACLPECSPHRVNRRPTTRWPEWHRRHLGKATTAMAKAPFTNRRDDGTKNIGRRCLMTRRTEPAMSAPVAEFTLAASGAADRHHRPGLQVTPSAAVAPINRGGGCPSGIRNDTKASGRADFRRRSPSKLTPMAYWFCRQQLPVVVVGS